MKMKSLIWNLSVIVVFGVLGLTSFTYGEIKTVQVLGIFATGWVLGAAFSNIIHLFKPAKKQINK